MIRFLQFCWLVFCVFIFAEDAGHCDDFVVIGPGGVGECAGQLLTPATLKPCVSFFNWDETECAGPLSGSDYTIGSECGNFELMGVDIDSTAPNITRTSCGNAIESVEYLYCWIAGVCKIRLEAGVFRCDPDPDYLSGYIWEKITLAEQSCCVIGDNE